MDDNMKQKHIFVIDSPTPEEYGKVGFILFGIAVTIVLLLILFFHIVVVLIAIGMFILGGFVGRAVEKRNKIQNQETKKENPKPNLE